MRRAIVASLIYGLPDPLQGAKAPSRKISAAACYFCTGRRPRESPVFSVLEKHILDAADFPPYHRPVFVRVAVVRGEGRVFSDEGQRQFLKKPIFQAFSPASP